MDRFFAIVRYMQKSQIASIKKQILRTLKHALNQDFGNGDVLWVMCLPAIIPESSKRLIMEVCLSIHFLRSAFLIFFSVFQTS